MSSYGEPTDAVLWSAAAAGDTQAFGALFDRHARAVYNHSFRLTGSWTVAEETVSATFLAAWCQHASIRLVQRLRAEVLAGHTTERQGPPAEPSQERDYQAVVRPDRRRGRGCSSRRRDRCDCGRAEA